MASLEEIIRMFKPFVIKTAKSIYIKGYALEDLIQIGQTSIIKAVSMYDVNRESGFTTYVTNTVTRNFYNLIRKNIKEASCCSINSITDSGSELIDLIPSEENLEENFEKKEEKILLRRALDKLSSKQREIIYWFYFENKSLNQYALEKGIGYRTAVDQKKKALNRLRDILKSYMDV